MRELVIASLLRSLQLVQQDLQLFSTAKQQIAQVHLRECCEIMLKDRKSVF